MTFSAALRPLVAAAVLVAAVVPSAAVAQGKPQRNVILFVADGLRRNSVTETDMPTFMRLRREGVDLRNSHSVFPTFTTANASAIATGHGLGDTGDYSNVIYPGRWLNRPDIFPVVSPTGWITPFLENDEILADMNAAFGGNYLGEPTLLGTAHAHGYLVASVGKLGPTAIQQQDLLRWDEQGLISAAGSVIIDDATGTAQGVQLPPAIVAGLTREHLALEAPLRTNGYSDSSPFNNGRSGDSQTPGTLADNHVQQQWYADVTTRVLLPLAAEEKKPFVLLFWSRDPDGTQHNEGDSLQHLSPGINGDTSHAALRNADHDLKQLLDWLDAHPAIKANTDVVVTSDHGFATISRREIGADASTAEPSAQLHYEVLGKEKPEPQGTLPTGFLAVDLGIRMHLRVFDSGLRASTGDSVYQELSLSGERSQHSALGSALLGAHANRLDGTDARVVVAANGGSDLLYVPDHSPETVHALLDVLTQLDYVAGVFVDDSFCPTPEACPGALPLSAIRLTGSSKVPRPAIIVNLKHFYRTPGDLQTGIQVSDTSLQEGQGMHGGFARDQTWNNMAAWGPDFKHGYVDELPVGNVDIVPTVAKILGFEMPANGSNKGRAMAEALKSEASQSESPKSESLRGGGRATPADHAKAEEKTLVSAPSSNGLRTVMQFQEHDGVRYFDQGCMIASKESAPQCP